MTIVADHTARIWALVAKEYWRKARRRLRAGPAYRWRYSGRTPERVLIAPPDLRLADPQIALEIYHGRFPLAGHMVETGGESPFQLDVPNRGWRKSLHGFRWLRHMRAAGTELAAANARALVSDWIAMHGGRIDGVAWEPGTTAKRIISWLQHSSVVLQGAEFPFYRAFLKSLAVQIRYLRSVAPEMPDGGHVSRNPMVVLEILADLLPLRQTYANQAETPPAALMGAIDRMLPALRFFRHQDGSVARFNGMGATIQDRIIAILRHDDTAGSPLLHAPHSGYERLSIGDVTVIADTGAPPPVAVSAAAHAGCLSFELSSGRQHFIVNAGIDTYGAAEFRPLARATAAHSTATLNDTSSARFSYSPRVSDVLGSPLIGGPHAVPCQRIDDKDRQGFVARHDGYAARFGLLHERQMAMTGNGNVLSGRDRFLPVEGRAARSGQDMVAVRFHVHPDVVLARDERERLVLAAEGGDHWLFTSPEVEPEVEESIYFAGLGGPRRSRQIVLHFRAGEMPEVRWQLIRTKIAGEL